MVKEIPKCCPKCKGTAGYTCVLTEDHNMGAPWGEAPYSGDCGNFRWSKYACTECGAKFHKKTLLAKKLVQ